MKNKKHNHYPTIKDACAAAKLLGVASRHEYLEKRHLDPRLPSCPDKTYKLEWKSWPSYLGKDTRKFYHSVADASAATQRLKIKSIQEYKERRHLDVRLPSCPNQTYKHEWYNWASFFNKPAKIFYSTLGDASNAAKALGISSGADYWEKRHLDPKLPSAPDKTYKADWCDWSSFLGKDIKRLYSTLAEASAAVKELGIKAFDEYKEKRHLDPHLPSSPEQVYKKEWENWPTFLGNEPKIFYSSLAEASAAAARLGLKTVNQYRSKRFFDSKLPYQPDQVFKNEWKDWPSFLGRKPKNLYQNLVQASTAARELGITSILQYRKRRHLDPRLPHSPDNKYKKQWQSWAAFFEINEKGKSSEMLESSRVDNGSNRIRYQETHEESFVISKTHSAQQKPHNLESKEVDPLGDEIAINFYPTLKEASLAARLLRASSILDYRAKRRHDPRLPSNPNKTYKDEWQSWPKFLGKKQKDIYQTMEEASVAAIALGFRKISEYQNNYQADPKLPRDPSRTYKSQWLDWPSFLGRPPKNFYSTLVEATLAALKLGISNQQQYRINRNLDSRLPSAPDKTYNSEWRDWNSFLLPIEYNSLADVKHAIKVLGIKDSREYREKRENFPFLPAHPDRKFKLDWVDWYSLCDIPRPYTYDEAVAMIAQEKLSGKREYIDFIIRSGESRLPRTPDTVYKDQWINWYVYLGNVEPFRIKNVRPRYHRWAECISEFFKTARGGGSKESHLCRFIRYYIEAYGMGDSPQEFLVQEKKDIRPFKEWLSANETKRVAHKILFSINEFLDYVIREYLTEEDDESGELVIARNAYNPFSNFSVDYTLEKNAQPSQTGKRELAYQYVKAAKEWIIPPEARSFSDLTHLQNFRADWFDIAPEKIDASDPNCVVRELNGKTQIWFPVFWMHTYALMSVPARGRQIAYCDSGEADETIPVISVSGSIQWEENSSPLSGLTKNQGFIQNCENGELGMHFTSNKTSSSGSGYSVAWIPENLAYWMILLRNWQAKYNTISRPMPWFECERTCLNEVQRIAKGSNCFLFRDFGAEEPGYFTGRLASRLSAALYQSQPSDLHLASLSEDDSVLSHYTSCYTPHCMRVSLITAYLDEFGLPLTTIMKVAGHSSVLMTLYYCRLGSENLRHRFSEGEKVAMQNKAYAAQRMIEQGRIDEIKNELIATTSDALNLISNDTPVGTYLFRDYGICPFGGQRCADGGEIIQSSQIRSPAPTGHLGSQNCIACRHFVTGPAFLGGLLSLGNEISLSAHLQHEKYSDLEQDLKELNRKINQHDDAAYDLEQVGSSANLGARNNLELEKRKTLSEIESSAKKLDSILCDFNKLYRHVRQCQALVNSEAEKVVGNDSKSTTKLIIQNDHELEIAYEDTSLFRQLSEVCENAEIYQSASSEMALSPRSQMLDKMALKNMVPLHMFLLDKKQQLVVGNQITRLMLDRLKCWTKVDALMDGRICLQDLSPDEQITKQELLSLASPKSRVNRLATLEMDLL